MTDKPQEWDEAFDKKFFTPEETEASDARVSAIQKEIDKKDVIKGLWCCTHPGNCCECWFSIRRGGDGSCLQDLLIAAHDLLEAQEPRLLTDDDFANNPNVDHDGFLPAWIEYRRDGDWNEYWGGQPDEWGVCRADRLGVESLRYWTSCPTDAHREATPWGK